MPPPGGNATPQNDGPTVNSSQGKYSTGEWWRDVAVLETPRFEVARLRLPLGRLRPEVRLQSDSWGPRFGQPEAEPAMRVELHLPPELREDRYHRMHWRILVFDHQGNEQPTDDNFPAVTTDGFHVDGNAFAQRFKVPKDGVGKVVIQYSPIEIPIAKVPEATPPLAAAAIPDSPRKVVAEFLRLLSAPREKNADLKDIWDLTTRGTNVSWGDDLVKLTEQERIRPLHQLGNDEQTMVLSAPFQDDSGRERVFSAILLKRDDRWLIDRNDAYRSPTEIVSLVEGFLLNPGVKFDVQADELTGVWHFPCASTLTFFADGKGVRVYEGPSGVPEKSERFRWDVSGPTLRTHWPDHTDTETIAWVEDDVFRIQNAAGGQSYYGNREEAIAPGSPHEFVVYDPRLTGQQSHCFGIDAERQRILDKKLTSKLDIADPHQTDASVTAWMKEHRVDAVGRVVLAAGNVTQLGLRTFEMLTIPAAADAWENATPAQTAEQIDSRLADWNKIGPVNDVLADGKAPATFIFQTREGSQGLLQITGAAEKNGVKIRYKVMKEAEETSAASTKATPPADPIREADQRVLQQQSQSQQDR